MADDYIHLSNRKIIQTEAFNINVAPITLAWAPQKFWHTVVLTSSPKMRHGKDKWLSQEMPGILEQRRDLNMCVTAQSAECGEMKTSQRLQLPALLDVHIPLLTAKAEQARASLVQLRCRYSKLLLLCPWEVLANRNLISTKIFLHACFQAWL